MISFDDGESIPAVIIISSPSLMLFSSFDVWSVTVIVLNVGLSSLIKLKTRDDKSLTTFSWDSKNISIVSKTSTSSSSKSTFEIIICDDVSPGLISIGLGVIKYSESSSAVPLGV